MNRDRAAAIALLAVAYLVGDDQALQTFMGETGLDPAELAGKLDDDAFLAGVLGFVIQDDGRVAQFADANGLRMEEPLRAWQILSGDDRLYRSI